MFSDHFNDHSPNWSPDGQWLGLLGVFVYGKTGQEGLRVVNRTSQEMRWIVQGRLQQFAWSPDSQNLFYLDEKGDLYRYTFAAGQSEYLANEVGFFSVSADGQWLGLSKRHPDLEYFTFYVLDLSHNTLSWVVDEKSSVLWGTTSEWSPIDNRVAILWTHKNFSRIAVYTMDENTWKLNAETKSARETYQQDYGEDLPSAEFLNMRWSPDGQQLFVIRAASDAAPGGEILAFDATLSDYSRLPFETNITKLVWLDNQWLAYVKGYENNACYVSSRGEIWLANMETLETRKLVTDTLSFEAPAWRP